MAESASFANFLQGAREKKKNEALAQQFLGNRGRTGSTPGAGSGAKSRNTSEKPTLLSRISGGAGVQKQRSSSAKPTGNIDRKWQHDLHKVNNPHGPAGRVARPDRPASASQVDRNNRTYDKFAPALNRNVNIRNNDAPGFNIKGVASSGPYTVIASNFAPGTTAADIEAVMTPHGGEALGCRLLTAAPTVMVELQFASRDGAENVIATFNNQKADGRMLYVYMKQTQGSNALVHSRPPPARAAQSLDDMESDTSAGARGGSFQDGRFGFTEGAFNDPPRGPRRRY